jgi:hypothetical protein
MASRKPSVCNADEHGALHGGDRAFSVCWYSVGTLHTETAPLLLLRRAQYCVYLCYMGLG